MLDSIFTKVEKHGSAYMLLYLLISACVFFMIGHYDVSYWYFLIVFPVFLLGLVFFGAAHVEYQVAHKKITFKI